MQLLLSAGRDRRLLNVGAGQGTFTRLLERRGFEVTSVDPSPAAVELLRRRVHGPVLAASAGELPFEDASFDGAVLGEVLEHIEDDLAALREVVRVVRPGGVLAASVPANPAWFGPSDEWAGHHRRYTREALLELCGGAGLEVERLRAWGFPVSAFYHRRIYEPRLSSAGPSAPRWYLRPAVAALGAALQVDRSFVGVASLSPRMPIAPGARMGAQPVPASVALASDLPSRESAMPTEPSVLFLIVTAICCQTPNGIGLFFTVASV